VLGVTGCIAAYKAADLVRRMQDRGWRVKVVMTAAAAEFITPLTMQTLSGEPVATELFKPAAEGPLPHLSLAEEADVFVVAPATANFLAKLGQGIADDLLSTTALATRAPIVLAPAMNTKMWADEATQANLGRVYERGAIVVGPGEGVLACGEEGEGRLAPTAEIVDAVSFELDRARALEGRTIVVTAGGTQEPIDPVRFVGNRSSGRMGYAISDEAARMGAQVTLVSAPSSLPRPLGVTFVPVRTALEMRAAVREALGAKAADALVMCAAVADWRPAEAAEAKIKKSDGPMALDLVRNPDILAEIGSEREAATSAGPAGRSAAGPRVLVGFAAETVGGDELIAAAQEKLAAKSVDLVVANDVTEPGAGFETSTNKVVMVAPEAAPEWIGPASKRSIARSLLVRVAAMLSGQEA
jgi:phosphopantothenoylcysteine decarboxylase / phosphopantothenate---cysteine ligase